MTVQVEAVLAENTPQAPETVPETLAVVTAPFNQEAIISPPFIEASPVFVREEEASEQRDEDETGVVEATAEELAILDLASAIVPEVEEESVDESEVLEIATRAEQEPIEPVFIAEPEAALADTNQVSVSDELIAVVAEEQVPDIASIGSIDSLEASGFSELSGLIGVRARASSEWLQNISSKNAYTVQMAAYPIVDEPLLEEYLQLLSLTEILNETYLCLISRTSNRPQQWLVIHGDFNGVSGARDYIEKLPIYSRQYEPFARNSDSIACLSDTPIDTLLAF